MSVYADSRNAYRQGSVLSATPEQLVVMLYDGACRFLHQAGAAMRAGQIEAGHRKLRRAEEILAHLRATLDHDQGEIAGRLEAIYLYCERQLSRGRIEQDPARLEQVSGLLTELRSAWAAIGAQ